MDPKQKETYSREEIEDVCAEIERQWEYHLLIRSVFVSRAHEVAPNWESPGYFSAKGAVFKVEVPDPLTEILDRGLKGVGHWANQNYVIRLFGILDQHMMITAGRERNSRFTKLLALLRNMVGAHTRGYRNPERRKAREATKLIQELLDSRVIEEDVRSFNLSINTVLEKLKTGCAEFVRSLESQPKPIPSNKKCQSSGTDEAV